MNGRSVPPGKRRAKQFPPLRALNPFHAQQKAAGGAGGFQEWPGARDYGAVLSLRVIVGA